MFMDKGQTTGDRQMSDLTDCRSCPACCRLTNKNTVVCNMLPLCVTFLKRGIAESASLYIYK